MKNRIPAPDQYQEMREALRDLCGRYDSAYWQGVDTARLQAVGFGSHWGKADAPTGMSAEDADRRHGRTARRAVQQTLLAFIFFSKICVVANIHIHAIIIDRVNDNPGECFRFVFLNFLLL